MAFENEIFSVINRPTRVTWASATAIDHVLTNTIMDKDLQNGIIKLNISDHFPIDTIWNSKIHSQCPKTKISTQTINEVSVEDFKNIFSSMDWNDVLGKTITNESYNQFIKKYNLIYDDCFPIKVIEIKTKNLLSPWITKGIKESSKKKQKLYEIVFEKKVPKKGKRMQRL